VPGGRVEEPEGAERSSRGGGVLGQELEEQRQRAAVGEQPDGSVVAADGEGGGADGRPCAEDVVEAAACDVE
jgi:hypothetical protein